MQLGSYGTLEDSNLAELAELGEYL